ncbi:hypothetical protein PHLGIDRAFT_430031 [Phlebiopsis gigantea 11061_1 CR5-6]|uniref:Uncharacterized protein n=1 Tax=Phlebiopsis gigantea (strain 11061_1 CR5-6) TaxID=745531 RepID=A0A0C3RYD2_PHLG1|nr:hypothetical protein PHLGIDRAFT_430031 [Phlebiopsis gigantea 11061_1 CR5-6]
MYTAIAPSFRRLSRPPGFSQYNLPLYIMRFLSVAALFATASFVRAAIVPNVTSSAVTEPDICVEGTAVLIHSKDIDGKPYTVHSCTLKAGTSPTRRDDGLGVSLVKKNDDLCGAPCTTYCNGGSGGPNPKDCETMANAESGMGTFTITPGSAFIWSYASCQATMNNELSPRQDIVYCYDWKNWAGVVNYLAWNCQGTHGDNGGSCHFYDNTAISWIQVQTN